MVIDPVVKTEFWHKLENGRVQCDVCPRGCKLEEGKRGFCFVRARQDDEIVLTTYGRSSGFCIDPIEKKPLNHFLPGTPILSFGTAGCNLGCKFCQNWDISRSRHADTLAASASPQQLVAAAKKHGCRSIAFTYNDPIVFMEYAIDVAQAARENGIKTVAVTAGYIQEKPREKFFRFMDGANADLKAFTESFYKRLCNAELSPILETLEYLKRETTVWCEITNLLIPHENDSQKELEEMTQWVSEKLGPEVPIHFSAFHPDYKLLDQQRTPPESLNMARETALKNGLRYAYTGNVSDEKGASTYCHKCQKRLIGRNWYVMTEYNLDDKGECLFCGEPCSGVFDGPPGTWGAERKAISVS